MPKIGNNTRVARNAAIKLGVVVAVAALLPSEAFASGAGGGGGGMPYESFLKTLEDSVSGPLAYAIALLGVVGAGATLIFGGDMNGFLRSIILLVCFAALLISAPAMLKAIGGSGAVVAAATVDGPRANELIMRSSSTFGRV